MSGVPQQQTPKRTVLIVEDDPQIRGMLEKLLSKSYNVIAAGDGKQGLLQAKKHRPDLMLLDVMLPEIDGFDVATKARKDEQLKRTPIIFLTARDTALDTIKGIQAGAKHYITKPFNIKDVLSKVEKILK